MNTKKNIPENRLINLFIIKAYSRSEGKRVFNIVKKELEGSKEFFEDIPLNRFVTVKGIGKNSLKVIAEVQIDILVER